MCGAPELLQGRTVAQKIVPVAVSNSQRCIPSYGSKLEWSGRGTPGRGTPPVRRFAPRPPPLGCHANGRSDMTTHHKAL
jgi:hypothetical protein